jgi:hypothetical protein
MLMLVQAVAGDYIAEEADALDDPMRFHLPLSFGEQCCSVAGFVVILKKTKGSSYCLIIVV